MIKNILLGIVLPLLLVGTGVGVLISMQRPAPSKKPPVLDTPAALLAQVPAADVAQVHALAEISETLDIPVSGSVVPFREIQLAAEAAGRIIEKDAAARSGNFVEQGQVLFRIDPRDYELELQRLERKLEQERAALVELQQDVANSENLLAVAEEELQLTEADVQRFESLQGNFRSQAELDQAKRARLTSLNQRVSIQNQLNVLEARRARLELATKLVETELEQANLNLERTVIRSPVDGRVVGDLVEADSYVQRGTPLIVIEDTEKVEVACNLRMDQLYWILDRQSVSADQLVNAAQAARHTLPQVEATIRFEMSGRETVRYEWRGILDRYDGAGLDPQSRTVPIRVLVPQPNEFEINGQPAQQSNLSGPPALVRGMFVEVVIQARPTTPLLLVPKLSVKPATGTNQIWKFRPDDQALAETRAALEATGNLAAPSEAATAAAQEQADAGTKSIDDPEAWQAGYLTIIEGVEVVSTFAASPTLDNETSPLQTIAGEPVEYWVCEVPGGALAPGDAVVITPLPGVEAAGDETIRVRRQQL